MSATECQMTAIYLRISGDLDVFFERAQNVFSVTCCNFVCLDELVPRPAAGGRLSRTARRKTDPSSRKTQSTDDGLVLFGAEALRRPFEAGEIRNHTVSHLL